MKLLVEIKSQWGGEGKGVDEGRERGMGQGRKGVGWVGIGQVGRGGGGGGGNK